jgi:hypothetical protein
MNDSDLGGWVSRIRDSRKSGRKYWTKQKLNTYYECWPSGTDPRK